MRRLVASLAAGALLAVPSAALAQCPKTSLADIEDEVMCPTCGTPLALASEAPQGKKQREFILRLVDRCRSKEEIKTALAAEFGENVLAVPETEGFDLAAYLVPALALLAGGLGIGISAARWRRRRPARSPAAGGAGRAGGSEASPEQARLDADLRRYDA